jgi:DNA-directed RNA polymerase specialized sigma24 family protein
MSASDEGMPDTVLVERCLVGDEEAWRSLFYRLQPVVLAHAARLLGPAASRGLEAEEVAADVWYALALHAGRTLRSFDSRRGSLATFLALLVQQAVRQRWRRDRLCERRIALVDDVPCRNVEILTIGDTRWAEFVGTLSAGERDFLDHHLLAVVNPVTLSHAGTSNARKLKQRILLKLRTFLS